MPQGFHPTYPPPAARSTSLDEAAVREGEDGQFGFVNVKPEYASRAVPVRGVEEMKGNEWEMTMPLLIAHACRIRSTIVRLETVSSASSPATGAWPRPVFSSMGRRRRIQRRPRSRRLSEAEGP